MPTALSILKSAIDNPRRYPKTLPLAHEAIEKAIAELEKQPAATKPAASNFTPEKLASFKLPAASTAIDLTPAAALHKLRSLKGAAQKEFYVSHASLLQQAVKGATGLERTRAAMELASINAA